jgi:hypothetical protein
MSGPRDFVLESRRSGRGKEARGFVGQFELLVAPLSIRADHISSIEAGLIALQ